MMSNEEFDRRMEFFLNQQAQFDADIQQMKELYQRIGETNKQTEESLRQTVEGLAELKTLTTEGFRLTKLRFDAVARSFKVIAANSRETDARIKVLVDSQTRTDEKLKSTDAKLDRHLKEDHNGDFEN